MTEEMNNVEVEDKEMDNIGNTQGLKEEYLFVNCKFNYGGRTKNYGFINLIIDIETKSIIHSSAVLTSDREIWDINLHISFFKDELDELIEKSAVTEDKDLRLEIKENLDVVALVEADNDQEIERIIKEAIENVIQEAVSLNLIIEKANQEELKLIYPELFAKKSDSTSKEDDLSNDNSSLDGIINSGKLNIDIKLNCTPVISPVKGRRITELNLGDELVVKVNDDREISKSVASILEKNEDGDVVGLIREINYNEELDRYNVLVQFKSNIFGNLVVDPEVKVKSHKVIAEDEKTKKEGSIEIDQNLLIIGIFATIMVILIFGAVIYFT